MYITQIIVLLKISTISHPHETTQRTPLFSACLSSYLLQFFEPNAKSRNLIIPF
jgi:hypothetical protein